MDNNLGNKNSFFGLNWIINDAKKGFFFVLASHKMQERIADTYTADNIAKLNYSNRNQYKDFRFFDENNTEHFIFRTIDQFVDDNNEKTIFFILNFQIPFPTEIDILNLNMSRDYIANKKKIFIFFMIPELEERLYKSADDFHNYCNLKISFDDFGIGENRQKLRSLNNTFPFLSLHQINEIKERLARYREMETEYLSCFDEAPDGTVLLKKEPSNSQLLANANTLDNIAELYNKTGDYNKALEIVEKALGEEHPYTKHTLGNIHFVAYGKSGKPESLEEWQKKNVKTIT
jgi:tetratricopeptide (TPR) repeat protein